jgi:hypothetical protein
MLTGGVKSKTWPFLRPLAVRYFAAATKTITVKIVEVTIPAIPKKNMKYATTTAPLPLSNTGKIV